MCRSCFLIFLVLLVSQVSLAQLPVLNDDFPAHTPFLFEEDIEANTYPYYAIRSDYPFCLEVDQSQADSGVVISPLNNCERISMQYVFEPGRALGDGNSNCDLYFTDDSAISAAGKPLVILLHGGTGSRKSTNLIRRAIDFARRGYVAVLPDYVTARDAKWGTDIAPIIQTCISADQKTLMQQQSNMDVRSVARKVLMYSSQNPEIAGLQIDPTSIYLFGISHGAYTSLQVAASDISDFPSGEVNFSSGSISFADDLNSQAICPEPGGCIDWVPYPGWDLRGNIKAVAAAAPFVTNLDLFHADNMPATLFFHGTCDASAPYWKVVQADGITRAALSEAPGVNIDSLPCALNPDPNDILYGSYFVHKTLIETDVNQQLYKGFITFCGGLHDIATVYGSKGELVPNFKIHLIDYELYRFFANVQNQQHQESFQYVLDHNLLDQSPDKKQQKDRHCNAVTNAGEQWPDMAVVCGSCTENTEAYLATVRVPYFNGNGNDEDRYRLISEYKGNLPDCSTFGNDGGPISIFDYADSLVVQIWDIHGNALLSPGSPPEFDLKTIMRSQLNLPTGIYFVLFENEVRKYMKL